MSGPSDTGSSSMGPLEDIKLSNLRDHGGAVNGLMSSTIYTQNTDSIKDLVQPDLRRKSINFIQQSLTDLVLNMLSE